MVVYTSTCLRHEDALKCVGTSTLGVGYEWGESVVALTSVETPYTRL